MGASLTRALPGITGRIREREEDFVVEEVLSYEPCGEGTHAFVEIEKRGLTTFEAIRRIARALGRKESDVGCAGLKDKQAITRQTLSLEFATEEQLRALEIPGLTVRSVVRHKNKLKLGHLRGNRFCIVVRGTVDGDLERARAKLDVLQERGVPNAFGAQRFGRNATTPELGKALLAGESERFLRVFAGVEDLAATPEDLLASAGRDPLLQRALDTWVQRGKPDIAVRALPKRFLSLCVASLQSVVFNDVLSRRIERGAFDAIELGDIAYLHRNGACFAVDAREVFEESQARVQSFEISASGPLPGPSCLRATHDIATEEQAALDAHGVTHEMFGVKRPWGQKGGRRALRVPLEDCRLEALDGEAGEDAALELRFTLPKGSFATALLDELVC